MPAAATLASLPAEIHARIAALCALQDRRFKHAKLALQKDTTFPVADPSHTVPAPSTVGALSVLSKYWNQVAEPYRFSRLEASHLESRKFRLGFGRKFGRYITELDLGDLCRRDGADPTIVLDALPLLPNLHTVVTPTMRDVVEMVADDTQFDDPEATRYGREVSYVEEALFELFASVPSLVVDTDRCGGTFFASLATKSPKTRQLVLYDNEDARPERLVNLAFDALGSCPQLTELKLVISEELNEPFLGHDSPSECSLRYLSLSTLGGNTPSVFQLIGKFSPVLRSLELNFEEFEPSLSIPFAEGSHFPHLETLVASHTYLVRTDDFVNSISPTVFPVLRHLELRTRYGAPPASSQEATLTDLAAAFASCNSLPLATRTDQAIIVAR
ncbi:hypothetical protein C6P46_005558 [Rhodotorula mucilaginosa]|uniref:Proteophosphoglycan ppg4 n=1 Tax=Rhodotorula mucilaginosa TaxID=5537 RepID=A0A9P6W062_RHOMI|nr:hypothetical protein C6P46_005558 [Rhodotorula mucilaginosa]